MSGREMIEEDEDMRYFWRGLWRALLLVVFVLVPAIVGYITIFGGWRR